jgi:hypothetical protein
VAEGEVGQGCERTDCPCVAAAYQWHGEMVARGHELKEPLRLPRKGRRPKFRVGTDGLDGLLAKRGQSFGLLAVATVPFVVGIWGRDLDTGERRQFIREFQAGEIFLVGDLYPADSVIEFLGPQGGFAEVDLRSLSLLSSIGLRCDRSFGTLC